MKKVLLMVLGAVMLLTSCKDDEDNKRLNPYAKIYINGVERANKNVVHMERLSVGEILRLDSIVMWSTTGNGKYDVATKFFSFHYENNFKMDCNIDTINNRLMMDAGNINSPYNNPFFYGDNWFICDNRNYDTLAYIPNAQRKEAYEKIVELWDRQEWDSIYEIFNNAFTFIPCTAEELRELEASGQW